MVIIKELVTKNQVRMYICICVIVCVCVCAEIKCVSICGGSLYVYICCLYIN